MQERSKLITAVLAISLAGCQNLSLRTSEAIPVPEPEPAELINAPIEVTAESPVIEPAEDTAPQPVAEAPPEPLDIWQRIRSGFRMNEEADQRRVKAEMRWYLKNPDYLDRVADRASPHLHYIVGELEKRDMPLELALLPIVESAFDPFAYSHGRAAGLWQFIPATARVYGLKIDWWYDGRRDVRASTDAALDYLQHLHRFFNGNWPLALAAYNAGEGNVLKSIRKSGQSPDKADFWRLKVFRETYSYVPKLLALADIVKDPAHYGITLKPIADVPYWQVVNTGGQIDLHKAASLAELTPEELYKLNPGFNQWATHPDGPHELVIPVERVERFESALEGLDASERVAWKRHQVKYGESLSTIAQRYNTTVSTIKDINNLRGSMIRTGANLMIPTAAAGTHYAMSSDGRLASRQESLAKRYGTEPVKHVVRPGDSFWKIARQYGVGMRQLASWNGMGTSSTLRAGTELVVYPRDGKRIAAAPPRQQQIRKLNYRVREGESLSLIASKFNVTVNSIRKWNPASSLKKYIHPGDYLTLYVDVTALVN